MALTRLGAIAVPQSTLVPTKEEAFGPILEVGIRQLEFVLRARIRAGLDSIRRNPLLVDQIFPDLGFNSRQEIKEFLAEHEVFCLLSWPRDAQQIPSWSISMMDESIVTTPIGELIEQSALIAGQIEPEEIRGDYIRKTYQIYTFANQPDLTLVLSAILQVILKNMRQDLEFSGFHAMTVGTADALDFKSEFLPIYLYPRVTTITVIVEDTIIQVDTTARKVEIVDFEVLT